MIDSLIKVQFLGNINLKLNACRIRDPEQDRVNCHVKVLVMRLAWYLVVTWDAVG